MGHNGSPPQEEASEPAGAHDAQSLADQDQTLSERDQSLSDRDQELGERDQAASDEEQSAADRAGTHGGDASRAAASATRAETARQRAEIGHQRDQTGLLRDEAARQRDERAAERDRDAELADLEAAALDARDALAAEQTSRAPDLRRQATALRKRAAEHREQAARDRRRAARDRALDARDREQARREREHAGVDELTGARRRGVGLDELQREIERARREGDDLVAVYVDVDGLKKVNDSAGHAAGDELLREVVRCLRRHMRSYDLLMRLGGDEFLCVLPGVTVEEARRRFAQLGTELQNGPTTGSVSMGLTELRDGESPEELIERADRELLLSRAR
jgi:diguanylate cyclase (GGDEF)-like protein